MAVEEKDIEVSFTADMIRDMYEALTLEALGAKIDLVPEGCTLKQARNDVFTWYLELPTFSPLKDIVICFYTDKKQDLTWASVLQSGVYVTLNDMEDDVLEQGFSWLVDNGRIK